MAVISLLTSWVNSHFLFCRKKHPFFFSRWPIKLFQVLVLNGIGHHFLFWHHNSGMRKCQEYTRKRKICSKHFNVLFSGLKVYCFVGFSRFEFFVTSRLFFTPASFSDGILV